MGPTLSIADIFWFCLIYAAGVVVVHGAFSILIEYLRGKIGTKALQDWHYARFGFSIAWPVLPGILMTYAVYSLMNALYSSITRKTL